MRGHEDEMRHITPQRIVSLACSNTEILFALGLRSCVVGVDDWSDFPPPVMDLPRVGPELKIDMAKVAALKPDLIVASLSVPGMERNLPGLEQLGVPYLALEPKSLDDVFKDIRLVGEVTGVSEVAQRLVTELHTQIEAIQMQAQKATDRPTLYWEWWPRPLISPGRQSWMVQMSELAGADLLFKDVEAASFEVQESQVFEADPDCLMLCWCGTLQKTMDVKQVTERPGWDRLRAVKAGRIHCLPEALYGRPGPRLVEGLERMAQIVHPELFIQVSVGPY